MFSQETQKHKSKFSSGTYLRNQLMNLSLILQNICSFLPTPLSVKKGNRFFKKVLLRERKRVVSLCLKFDEKNLQENFSLVDISKIICFQFFDPHNIFSSNLNTTTLKIFPKHGGIYIFETKFRKTLERDCETVLVYHSVDPNLGIDIFCEKQRAAEQKGI